jgi:uncharacterized protein (DUF2147 family)
MDRKLFLFFVLTVPQLHAQGKGQRLLGDWREPGGSVVRIAPCGANLCLTLITLPPNPPSTVDHHNPDATLRTRPLCGLVIGRDFHPVSGDQADDGTLYDPRAGRTYHGEMSMRGDHLALRGYLGSRLFGRTEIWSRTATAHPCA